MVGRRVEVLRPADCAGNRVQRRLQLFEYLQGPLGGFETTTVADQQRIVEQVAQARQRRADCRLAEEEFFRCTGQVLLEHQGFEHHQQIHVYTTQIVAVHLGPPAGCLCLAYSGLFQ
ncbi:hypothetical protein D9M71_709540 [compost metagenome]